MVLKKTQRQKLHKLGVGVQTCTVEFAAANSQFDWLEISLVYYKINRHAAVYDTYNLERASTSI